MYLNALPQCRKSSYRKRTTSPTIHRGLQKLRKGGRETEIGGRETEVKITTNILFMSFQQQRCVSISDRDVSAMSFAHFVECILKKSKYRQVS